MKKSVFHIIGFLLLFCFSGRLAAQQPQQSAPSSTPKAEESGVARINIRGTVFENESLHPMQGASVKLFDAKGTMVSGNVTMKNGQFLLPGIPTGSYTLKVSFMGFKEQSFSITLPSKSGNYKINDVLMREETTMMKEAVVEGQMPEMTVVEDTVMYNADAFKLPDGALVEDLIKKLPGIVLEDNGSYTWNGKSISQILVDGKEFFGNNMELVLKNLPAEIIDKVKAYDRQSENARITGIDDGNERTVLDLAVKKNRKRGWFGNVMGGYGSSDRYTGRFMTNRFIGDQKFSVVGNANNTEGDGMTDHQSGGFTMNYEKKKVLELNGSLNGNFTQGSSESSTSRQSFENRNAAYSNSTQSSGNHSNGVNFNYKVEWSPDTMTKVIFRPELSYRQSGSHSQSESAAFNADPFSLDGITDPLAQLSLLSDSIGVNHRLSANHSGSDNFNTSASLRVNRRMRKKGRNLSFEASGSYSNGNTESDSYSQIDYYQRLARDGTDSVYHKTQFNDSQSKNRNWSASVSYNEPIAHNVYLQFSYAYRNRFTDHDRTVSSIFDPYNARYGVVRENYRQFSEFGVPDTAQCNYTTNTYQNHDARLQLRINRTQYQLTIGGNVQPQINSVDYNKGWKHYDVSRTVVNASPTVNFRYRFSRHEQFDFRYGGSTGQPSITDLIPDTLNNANPLNIQLGNPNLKPSFTQNLGANYRKSIQESQRSYAASLQFNTTRNSVSNRTQYDEETGGRVTQPMNINGNWNGSASFNFNTAFRDQRFRINTNTQTSMTNAVGYVYQASSHETVKNRTRGNRVSQGLRLTFRNDWLEVNANGSLRYNHSRSTNSSASNLDTYGFNYGVGTEMQFPWNMTFSTSITEQCRRGYSDASMNTNELIWGFQFSQRLLPKKNLTITVRANDVLNQRDNVSRNVSATARTDTRTLNVHSYYLLTVNYRFGKFGGGRGKKGDFGERGEGDEFGSGRERHGGPDGNEGPRGGSEGRSFNRGGGPGGGPGGSF